QSAANETERVEREVQVAVQLQPRVPGRPILAGDDGAAEDVAANPGDYDTIQGYTLFADGGGGDSLVLDPGGRIEGPIWLKDDLELFEDPAWSSGVRRDVLASIGERLASGSSPSAARHPHPLAGEITFHSRP